MKPEKLKTFILQWNHYIANSCHLERGKQEFVEYAAEEILGKELKARFYEALGDSPFTNGMEITSINKFIATLIEPEKVMCYMIQNMFEDNLWDVMRVSDGKPIDVLDAEQAAKIKHKNFLWQVPVKD